MDDHSASRRVDVLAEEAPHLIADSDTSQRYCMSVHFTAGTDEEARRWFAGLLSQGLEGWRDQIRPYDSELLKEAQRPWLRVDVLDRGSHV